MGRTKTLIRLRGCGAGCYESSLGAHITKYIFSRCGSINCSHIVARPRHGFRGGSRKGGGGGVVEPLLTKSFNFMEILDTSDKFGIPYLPWIVASRKIFLVILFNKFVLLLINVCKIAIRVANSVYPDQTPRSAASDLGLHCLLWTVFPNT